MILQIADFLTDERQKLIYKQESSVDLSYAVLNVARFRVNLYTQMGSVGAVFRQIPEEIPSLSSLLAPAALLDFSKAPRGLLLVTGPTGSGKSTTLAAVINKIINIIIY
jgi:twitching motility protein PilT